jgi:hypothetical protein
MIDLIWHAPADPLQPLQSTASQGAAAAVKAQEQQ